MKKYDEIYLDPEESLKSFLEKLQKVNKKKIVVIVHQRSAIFIGQVNIELIKKYAKRAEKELIFITKLKKIKNLLTEAGFEVYTSLDEINVNNEVKKEAELPAQVDYKRTKFNSRASRIKKTVLFLLVAIMIGALYFYLKIPLVTISVRPVLEERKVITNLTADLTTQELDFTKQKLPLVKEEIELKTETKIKASGEKSVGVKAAQGVVTFINNTQEEVVIPSGTVIRTRNGIKYKTLKQAVVPKMKVEKMMDVVVGAQAGKEEVNIQAVIKGEHGNVSKGRIVEFVNSSYPVKLFNPEALHGGKNRLLSQITESDIKRGLKRAKEELNKKMRQKLKAKFNEEMLYLREQLQVEKEELVSENKAGELAARAVIKGRIKAVGFAISKQALKDLVFSSYQKKLETEFSLYSDKIQIKELKVSQRKPKSFKLEVLTLGKVIGELDQVKLIDRILGKKVANVKSLLDNMNEVDKYKIKPNNQVNLPQFKFGVKLIVVEPLKE